MSFLSAESPPCLPFVYFSSTFVFRIPSTFDVDVTQQFHLCKHLYLRDRIGRGMPP